MESHVKTEATLPELAGISGITTYHTWLVLKDAGISPYRHVFDGGRKIALYKDREECIRAIDAYSRGDKLLTKRKISSVIGTGFGRLAEAMAALGIRPSLVIGKNEYYRYSGSMAESLRTYLEKSRRHPEHNDYSDDFNMFRNPAIRRELNPSFIKKHDWLSGNIGSKVMYGGREYVVESVEDLHFVGISGSGERTEIPIRNMLAPSETWNPSLERF